ncbi:MAG: C1 family peptidase [Calditrichaeota bacterium]|nr:C1 family peptidase [Calditrichota bacterium]
MKKCFSSVFLLLAALTSGLTAAEPERGLTRSEIDLLVNSVELDARTRTAINAVSNNDIRDLAMNREVTAVKDEIFSFKLPTKGITDQEGTGRCWLFAGLNLLRQEVVKKFELDDFELSQSYLAFWDKLEKSNVFLEFIIETRDRDLLDREVHHMLDEPIGDGGYWGYVVGIVEKYGVLPKSFMDETRSSSETGRMNYILETMLRRDALRLRTLAAEGKSTADLRREKMTMLKDIFRVLVINYGMPPKDFVWRTVDKDGKASEPVTYTPQEFYKEVIGVDLSQFVSLANYPIHPLNKHYRIHLTRGMADKADISFVNLDASDLKSYALKALQDSQRVWFGCDMGHGVHGKKGIMAKELYDYEELFGVPLAMTKTERLNSRHSANNHAMVFVGVDILDGKPRKWLVENSWGDERGDKGFFTMTDDWFDEYVFDVVVPKKYLPEDVLAILEQPPVMLPVWDPSWQSLR